MDNIRKVKNYLRKIGKESELSSVKFGDNLPEVRGVYFVANSSGGLLYIGIAENLSKRWRQHHKYKECLKNQAQRIYFWKTSTHNIGFTEAWLISELKTLLNVAGVSKTKPKPKPKSKSNKKKTFKSKSKKPKSNRQLATSIGTVENYAGKIKSEQKELRNIMSNLR